RHFGDGVSVPVARSDTAFIKHGLFVERVADAHDGATFDLALQLKWIDDNAGIDGYCVFFDSDGACARGDRNFADASPIGAGAKHGRDAATADGSRTGGCSAGTRRGTRVPTGSGTNFFEDVDEALFFGVVDAELDCVCSGKSSGFAEGEFARIVLLVLARS